MLPQGVTESVGGRRGGISLFFPDAVLLYAVEGMCYIVESMWYVVDRLCYAIEGIFFL